MLNQTGITHKRGVVARFSDPPSSLALNMLFGFSESRASRDQQKKVFSPRDSARTAQNNSSVLNNSAKECDLGKIYKIYI